LPFALVLDINFIEVSNDYHESLRVGNVEHAAKNLDFGERNVTEAESYLPTRAQKPKGVEVF